MNEEKNTKETAEKEKKILDTPPSLDEKKEESSFENTKGESDLIAEIPQESAENEKQDANDFSAVFGNFLKKQKEDKGKSSSLGQNTEEKKEVTLDDPSSKASVDFPSELKTTKQEEKKDEIDFSLLRKAPPLGSEDIANERAESAISAAFENNFSHTSSEKETAEEITHSLEKPSFFSRFRGFFQKKEISKEKNKYALIEAEKEENIAFESDILQTKKTTEQEIPSTQQKVSIAHFQEKPLSRDALGALGTISLSDSGEKKGGNAFAEVFNTEKKEDGKELIETIMQTAKEEQDARSKVLGARFSEQIRQNQERSGLIKNVTDKSRDAEKMLAVSRFIFAISLLVPLGAWIIFNALLDPQSSFSRILSAHNYGSEIEFLLVQKSEKEGSLKKIEKEIVATQEKIENIKNNKILANIIQGRVDFLKIMLQINNITLAALNLSTELNQALQELTFNTYTGSTDAGKTEITISGTVRDPQKKSLTRLTKLMETINNDPSFDGAALRSFSKSDDRTGGSQSSFSFRFQHNALGLSDETLHTSSPK